MRWWYPYGTMSTVEDDIHEHMDKIVVDDWGQCLIGPFGCLRRHVDSGKITQQSIHGELGEICAGKKPGRETDSETCLFWHRGLSTSDIALGAAMLEKADRLGIGPPVALRMININSAADINWQNLEAVAYQNELLQINEAIAD